MRRAGNRVEGTAEKGEFSARKLFEVGKRGGPRTPVASFWSPRELKSLESALCGGEKLVEGEAKVCSGFLPPRVSARRLGASVWELNQYNLPIGRMQHGGDRFLHRRIDGLPLPGYPSPDLPDLAGNSTTAPRLQQPHPPDHALQAASPSTYTASLEIAPYNFAGSTERTVNAHRASRSLVKVLNRVWSLEEQYSSNKILVNALKQELDKARSQIKLLLSEREELDELKLMRENSLVCRSRDEEKCRRMVEELCDSFALRIKEMLSLRQKNLTENGGGDIDELMLRVAETWLDERRQIQLQGGHERTSALGSEIKAFLAAERQCRASQDHPTDILRRSSLESIPMNSAEGVDGDTDISNCFELVKMSESMVKSQGQDTKRSRKRGKKKGCIFPSESENGVDLVGSKSKHAVEILMKNRHSGNRPGEVFLGSSSSIWRNQSSPVRQWGDKLPFDEAVKLQSSSKLPADLKENSLKAMLIEARTKPRRSQSRVKASI